jgi:16S rRNA (guanine966-N2)-methyltransferase
LRIVAGDQRGVRLSAPPGRVLRPTADRVREAIFNILAHGPFEAPSLSGASVLDVFAGTGALGLEALSRGAAHATFIENSRIALGSLRDNIARCRRDDQSTILERDALTPPPSPSSPKGGAPADFVFIDPPYRKGLMAPALDALKDGGWIAPVTFIIAEMAADDAPPDGWRCLETRRYGAAQICFLGLESADQGQGD